MEEWMSNSLHLVHKVYKNDNRNDTNEYYVVKLIVSLKNRI